MDQSLAANITPPNFVSQRSSKRRREDDLEGFKKEIISMIKSMFATQENEIKKIASTLKEIKETNLNIENSMAFLTKQNEEFKKKMEEMEIQAKRDKEYIILLEDKIEDLQRGSRKSSIEIKNVPKYNKETKENLIDMVVSLSKNINCEIKKTDICDIYRIKGKKQGTNNTPVVVEMSSTILKTDVLRMCKSFNIKHKEKLCAKHLGFKSDGDQPIFVSEQLTAKGARLHFLARDLTKSKGYKYCWTAYGKVYVKQHDDTPAILIKNESQVQALMLKL